MFRRPWTGERITRVLDIGGSLVPDIFWQLNRNKPLDASCQPMAGWQEDYQSETYGNPKGIYIRKQELRLFVYRHFK
jgi:hypothetical protein